MTVHRIRLREPWDAQRVSGSREIVYQRSFKRPTGLVPDQRVCLRVELSDFDEATLTLNDVPIPWECVELAPHSESQVDETKLRELPAITVFQARIDRHILVQNRIALRVDVADGPLSLLETPPPVGTSPIREVAICIGDGEDSMVATKGGFEGPSHQLK